jgi:hypothetical protein
LLLASILGILSLIMLKVYRNLAIVAVALVAGLVLWLAVINPLIKGPSFTVNVDRVAVIKQVRSLARLETASYTIEKIIDAKTNDTNALQKFLFGDQLLLIAHGQVIAGLDLSLLSEKEIKVGEKSVEITLPPAQVLVTSLDNSQTKVYDRKQGVLRQNDTELEATARAEAEKSIRTAACTSGILDTANENAKRQLTSLLTGLGFETVTIHTTPGTCN